MSDHTTLKTCTQCRESKPANNEHFYPCNGKLRSICKVCSKANVKKWQEANAEKTNAYKKKHQDANRDRKNSRAREYRAANPEKAKAYRETNAEAIKIYKSIWYKLNLAQAKLARRAWYKLNAVKARSRGMEYGKVWRAANAEYLKIKGQRRRARKAGLTDNFSVQDWEKCLDHFSGHCAVCGRPPGLFHTLAADHWIPLSSPNCIGTVPKNIVPLCHGLGGCNNAKSNKDALPWLIEKFGDKKGRRVFRKVQAYFDSLV